MRIAVLSDIHANLPALQAVAKDIRSQRADEIWSLGDVVGYGGQPRECLQWIQDHAQIRLQGNHDHAIATGDLKNFNPVAREAATHHRDILGQAALDQLADWKPTSRLNRLNQDILLAHGSPDDPLWEYVTTSVAPSGLTRWSGQARIILIGHTHQPFVAQTPMQSWSTRHFLQALVSGGADKHPLLLVNPGSVGQPRDGDARASYTILDFANRNVELRRIDYDVRAAADAILDAGLPSGLAWRLERGI